MSRCTEELIWLNEREEEELAFDWSDGNTNVAAKKQLYAVRVPSGCEGLGCQPQQGPGVLMPLGSCSGGFQEGASLRGYEGEMGEQGL